MWRGFIAALIACVLIVIACMVCPTQAQAKAESFIAAPKDRPVLEHPRLVYQAQTERFVAFRDGGVWYVVENMPKDYISYSSFWNRMP